MRKLNILVSCLAIGGLGLSAMAQDNPPPRGKDRPAGGGQPGGPGGGGGMRGMQLSPEKAKAAQEAEATGVAKRLGLNDAQTKALVNAYIDARAGQAAALQKARKDAADKNGDEGGGGGRRGGEMMKAMEEVNKAEREKFDKALGTNIPADAKTKVIASLGSFPIVWDRMVDTLSDFKLDAKKNQEALNAIEDFVVASGKARSGGDPEEMRGAMQTARQTLSDSMKKILTDEQFTKFEQSMGGGRGGQRRGGGGGGGGGEGGGNK